MSLLEHLDSYFFWDNFIWICLLLYFITFNYKKTHWFNLVAISIVSVFFSAYYFYDVDYLEFIGLAFILAIIVHYVFFNKIYNLNAYWLADWGTYFIEFIKKPTFKHKSLTVKSKLNFILHFSILKLFFSILFILPISNFFEESLSLKRSGVNIDLESYWLVVNIALRVIVEEIMFRSGFRKPLWNLGIYILNIIFLFEFYYAILAFWIYFPLLTIPYKVNKFYIKYLRWFVLLGAIIFGLAHHNSNAVDLSYSLIYLSQVISGICYIWITIRYGIITAIGVHLCHNLFLTSFLI